MAATKRTQVFNIMYGDRQTVRRQLCMAGRKRENVFTSTYRDKHTARRRLWMAESKREQVFKNTHMKRQAHCTQAAVYGSNEEDTSV